MSYSINGRMVMDKNWKKMWREAIITYMMVVSQNLPGRTE
jgi:hypothetical protein